jgi:tyrosyl-tRNA synthetase
MPTGYGLLLLALCSSARQELVTYRTQEELVADYRSGRIHPGDLKAAVSEALNRILDPVRRHFETGEPKKLLDKIKKYKITK